MKSYETNISHKPPPSQKGEWIGIEIECYIPYGKLKIKKSKGYYEDYTFIEGSYSYKQAKKELGKLLNKHDIPNATVKSDGSIESPNEKEFFEVEICLLFNRNNYEPLQRLCRLLKSLSTQVNNTCGLHVHLDCRDLKGVKKVRTSSLDGPSYTYEGPGKKDLMRRAGRLGKVLPLMEGMVDGSRLDNEYCQLEVSRMGQGKYYAINTNSFLTHKTIEVRLHHSSIDFKEIHDWAEFLYFVSRNKIESEEIIDFEDFKKELPEAPKEILRYVKRQAA